MNKENSYVRPFVAGPCGIFTARQLQPRLMHAAVFWLLLQVGDAFAQQREPAFEVYGLTGSYFHGNFSIAREWKPQFGGGVIAPLGRNWGAMLDVTTSAVELYWIPDGLPAASSGSNFTRERRVALLPALVRLWRRDRFSAYGGGGLAFEHERQHSRFRPIIDRDPNGRPILADDIRSSESTRTEATLALRFGAIVSLRRAVVVRAGYSWLPRYKGESASKSLEFGVGYRF